MTYRNIVVIFSALGALLAVSVTAETVPDPNLAPRVMSIETSGPMVLTGCSSFGATRENAVKNLGVDKLQCLATCAATKILLPAMEIVKQCGARCGPPQGNDLNNYLDLIAGQKAGAREAGAKIPDDPDPSAGSTYQPKVVR